MRRRRYATGGTPRINCPNGMVWINGECMNVVPPPGGHDVMGMHVPVRPGIPIGIGPATADYVRPGIPLGVGPATADNYLPNRGGSDWRAMAGRSRYREPMRRGGRTRRYMHGGHAHGNRSCPGGYCGGGRAMSNGNGCGPGYHMMPDGTCMEGDYHGQYSNGYARGGHIAPGVGVCDGPSTGIDGFGNNIC